MKRLGLFEVREGGDGGGTGGAGDEGPSRKLSRRLDVEALSDTRWARIERNVLEASALNAARAPRSVPPRADAPPARWRLAAAALVLAGAVATIAGGFAWRAMTPQAGREGTTRVETAANGSRVEFGESTIDVGPTSAVRLAGDDTRGVVVTLDRGQVECDVTPRKERPPFLVEAGGVEVRVIGTHFVVARTGDSGQDRVSVEVQRGVVEVTSGGVHALVPAGSRWPSAPSAVAPTEPPPKDANAAPRDVSPSPPAEPSREPRAALDARGDARSAGASRAQAPREQYEAASRLEATQPSAAIALYRELAHQGGAWGANALFAAGRLEADRGDHDDARRLLREYLAKYPAGPNANDARELLDRLR
ncbi:MAG TPA: FecR domain-containing protein [Polyangiaceae bacterium]|jgi:ferric-dicitrate binding protein FerR (iron transport regulator)|nr:FecR domain-containing protein [Polyangiaceae bacterium]